MDPHLPKDGDHGEQTAETKKIRSSFSLYLKHFGF
jgi:hypothetical protein